MTWLWPVSLALAFGLGWRWAGAAHRIMKSKPPAEPRGAGDVEPSEFQHFWQVR